MPTICGSFASIHDITTNLDEHPLPAVLRTGQDSAATSFSVAHAMLPTFFCQVLAVRRPLAHTRPYRAAVARFR